MTGRPLKDDAIANLVAKWNKTKPRVVCTCGKITTEDRLDKHQQTLYHHQLLMRLQRVKSAREEAIDES